MIVIRKVRKILTIDLKTNLSTNLLKSKMMEEAKHLSLYP